MNSIELLTIQLRLDGIRQAITRVRFTFLVSTIASIAIIITTWNAYVSQDKYFAMQPHWSHDLQFTAELQKKRLEDTSDGVTVKPEDLTKVTDYAQQQLVSEWVKNQTISVGLLGIRVSVGDLPELGSLTMLIISIWLYFSVSRENRAIGGILKHAAKLEEWDERYLVYQGIINHSIFLDFGRGHEPVTDYKAVEKHDVVNPPIIRRTIKSLFFLPVISVLFVLVMDLLTFIYLSAPFRPSQLPLWHILDSSFLKEIAIFDGLAILLLVLTTVMCIKSLRFTKASGEILNKFRSSLCKDWELLKNQSPLTKWGSFVCMF